MYLVWRLCAVPGTPHTYTIHQVKTLPVRFSTKVYPALYRIPYQPCHEHVTPTQYISWKHYQWDSVPRCTQRYIGYRINHARNTSHLHNTSGENTTSEIQYQGVPSVISDTVITMPWRLVCIRKEQKWRYIKRPDRFWTVIVFHASLLLTYVTFVPLIYNRQSGQFLWPKLSGHHCTKQWGVNMHGDFWCWNQTPSNSSVPISETTKDPVLLTFTKGIHQLWTKLLL